MVRDCSSHFLQLAEALRSLLKFCPAQSIVPRRICGFGSDADKDNQAFAQFVRRLVLLNPVFPSSSAGLVTESCKLLKAPSIH
jgi:hypothetical protein